MAKQSSPSLAFVWFGRLMLIVSIFLIASGVWVDVRAAHLFDNTALLLIGMGFLTFGINPVLYLSADAKADSKPEPKTKKKSKKK